MNRFLLVLLASFLLAVLVSGCSAARRQGVAQGLDQGLNILTDVVDPAYEGAVEVCDWTEGEVIRSHERDELEAARAQMLEVRAMCDGIFSGFEAAREAQQAARLAADALEDDRATALEALGAARAAQEAYEAVRSSIEAFRAWRAQHELTPPHRRQEESES